MNDVLLTIVAILLGGGVGAYLDGPAFGSGGLGRNLLIGAVIYLTGGFRRR